MKPIQLIAAVVLGVVLFIRCAPGAEVPEIPVDDIFSAPIDGDLLSNQPDARFDAIDDAINHGFPINFDNIEELRQKFR